LKAEVQGKMVVSVKNSERKHDVTPKSRNFWYLPGTMALIAVCGLSPANSQAVAPSGSVPIRGTNNNPGTSRSFNIPAQPLANALNAFGRQSGLQITLSATTSRGITSNAVQGTFTPEQALAQLLRNTGISFHVTADRTAVIGVLPASAPVADGTVVLDPVDVSGGRGNPADLPYQTPGSVNYISEQDIQRFRGTSTGDMFVGTPGVIASSNRNGAAIDLNIRGMQGMNRVATTIDGSDQSTSTWRGYAGVDNRSYVDPDMVGGITVTKGPDGGSAGAIGGTVAIETLSVSDILKPGDTYGTRVKVSGNSNGVSPNIGATTWRHDEPSIFDIRNGSVSAAVAATQENADFVGAFVRRKSGNYFAGTQGPLTVNDAQNSLGTTVLNSKPLSAYKYGDEVLNTSQDVASALLKTTLRPADGHELKLGYLHYDNVYGEVTPTIVQSIGTLSRQVPLIRTIVDQMTARYNWKPADTDLVDFKLNAAMSSIDDDTVYSVFTDSFYRKTQSKNYGLDAANTSRFDIASTVFSLRYGGSLKLEDAAPREVTTTTSVADFRPADGTRRIGTLFVNGKWEPVRWLAVDAGATYLTYETHYRGTPPSTYTRNPTYPSYADYTGSGVSPSFGITLTPVDGWQIFGRYTTGIRPPSLRESTYTASALVFNPNLRAEQARNWEVGTNYIKNDLVFAGDKARLKVAYFDNVTDDYIGRRGISSGVLGLFNYDKVVVKGVELSGGYDAKKAFVDFAFNYYTDFKPCFAGGNCVDYTLQTDYLTNYVPPRFTASATLGVRLLDEKLTVGGRVNYVGERMTRMTPDPLFPFVGMPWVPYTVVDAFTQWKISEDLTFDVSAENLLDRYYVDALNRTDMPAPGRTIRASLTGKFGGSAPVSVAPFGRAAWNSPGSDWTGFYVGVHMGYGSGAVNGTTAAMNPAATNAIPATNSALRARLNGVPATESANQSLKNLLGGAQFGFNYQFANRTVFGAEADFSGTSLGSHAERIAVEAAAFASNNQFQDTTDYKFNWLATLRGRAGYAFDRLLVFGTGGVGFLKETETRTQFITTATRASSPVGTMTQPWFKETADAVRIGWVLGAGGEYAFGSNWSLKAEYLYAHFGATAFDFPNARAGVVIANTVAATRPGSSTIVNGREAANEATLHTVKLGLNYHF
jgi:hemoglobin/transferrin/lactoferrin receptor protein